MASGPAGADDAARLTRAIQGQRMPCALVDMDAFEQNVDCLVGVVRPSGKRLRVATKSVRCVDLLHAVARRGEGVVHGWMTYTAAETRMLAERGFDDLLLAYPTVQRGDVEDLVAVRRSGKLASVVVDAPEHLEALEAVAREAGANLPVVVELDLGWRPFGERLHLGVRRSPMRTVDDVRQLVARIDGCPHLTFRGVMAYEAQIAGLPDALPYSPALNPGRRFVRTRSRRYVESVRAALWDALSERKPEVFNGGGTGSLSWCCAEPSLTEVTAGSGFLDSMLFDYYRDLRLRAAAFFALQVVRVPAPGIVTCHGGGLIASGAAGEDRLPRPWFPTGLSLLGMEGAGEVQTPLEANGATVPAIGDPVFFRHAKAGELAEHFNDYLLVRGDAIEARARTYRGEGHAFLG